MRKLEHAWWIVYQKKKENMPHGPKFITWWGPWPKQHALSHTIVLLLHQLLQSNDALMRWTLVHVFDRFSIPYPLVLREYLILIYLFLFLNYSYYNNVSKTLDLKSYFTAYWVTYHSNKSIESRKCFVFLFNLYLISFQRYHIK
jgi:hypothetical protein